MHSIKINTKLTSESKISESIKNRALGLEEFNYYPYHCFIEYKFKDQQSSIEYRDCIIDYTRCPNQNCIKKLV